MATRCKTIEFVFPTDATTLAESTQRDINIDVYLPESSKVFRSVTLEAGCTDDLASASSATSFSMDFELITDPTDPADLVTVADTLTDSGESSVYHISRDLTGYFASNWAGTTMEARVGLKIVTNRTNNHWAKLRITYEYDDQSTTHVKTIWYPIENTRSLLTTSYQTIGGDNAIPAIKGGTSILPEENVTVRQVWIELIGNQYTASTTDFSLDVKLTTESVEQPTLYRVEAALETRNWLHAIWDITDNDLEVAQPFEAKVTGVSDRVAQLCGWIGITYEFEPADTETVWNSLMLPAFDASDQHGATTSARKSLHVKDLWIAEPDDITTWPSQVFAFYNENGNGETISLWVNGQSPHSFTPPATGAVMVVSQRIDPGGVSGLGIQLGRGLNRLKLNVFTDSTDAGAFSALNGFMIVNYTSAKAALGVGAHNHTCHFATGYFQEDSTSIEYSSDTTEPKTPTIPESQYFLNGVAMQAAWLSTASHQAIRVQAQRTGTEGPGGDGAGWANIYHGAVVSDAENWLRWTTADATHLFRRWSDDPDTTRMDIEAARRWMVLDAASVWVGAIGLLVTYHSVTHVVHGTVRGTAGDGSGLTVNISRNTTGEKILAATTQRGGYYETSWYDDTEQLISDVYEDDSHTGRSAPFYAGE
jgi:hypothetical protein